MKKLLIWLPGMLSMLAACTEAVEIPARAPEKQSPVRVELHLTTEQQAATRAMDENCIRDVNLYLYGDTEYHFYFPSDSSPLVFNVLPGNYRSYAIANAGQDLGDKNAFKIQFYETAVDDFTFTAFLCIKNKKHKKIDSLTGFTHHQGIYFSFINLSTSDLLMSYCVTYQTETVHLLKSASVSVRVAFE